MSASRRFTLPLLAGLGGSALLAALYLGIVSIAQAPKYAFRLFWDDKWIVLPIIVGFGVQVALYTILKKRLFVPVAHTGPSAALTGASGATSTVAMVACCLHRVMDVLPILGLTAATTFLARYRIPFMLVGLGMTLSGIVVMLVILFRERRRAMALAGLSSEAT
jgi:Cu+-exporting ATPase